MCVFVFSSKVMTCFVVQVRHCYTEQTVQLDRLKQIKQQIEEEKKSVEASCKRLENELDAAAQQARDKEEAHTTALSNIQTVKNDLQIAFDGNCV